MLGTTLCQITGAVFLYTAIFLGCSNQNDEADPAQQMSNEEALTQLLAEDEDMESTDSWSGEDTGGPLDDPITPLHWVRMGHRESTSFNVVFQGDTFATITRQRTFSGELRIVTEETDSGRTVIAKDMHNVLTRKAHAVRVGRFDNPRRNWRIVEITPEVLESSAPNPHTVWPTRVQVFTAGDAGLELLADISDPLNYFINRETLMTIGAEQRLVVYATVNVSDPAVAVLHPHAYRGGNRTRQPLHDDGIAPDEVAADGIYTGGFLTGALPGVFHAAVDLLDWETLYDSNGSYDAGGWALPYRVLPSE
jgi:hypothetical protein